VFERLRGVDISPANSRIAVIGGGIAGLTAGYLLHDRYDVTLFERSERLGGNACTITAPDGQEVDIAVAVYGGRSYKNLLGLFKRIKIETVGPFSFRGPFGLGGSFLNLDTREGIYLTPSLQGVLSQRFRILRPVQAFVLIELLRGLKKVNRLLVKGSLEGLTVEDMLRTYRIFRGDAALLYLGSLCLISSMHCEDLLRAPASFFADKARVYHDLLPPEALFSVRLTKFRTRKYLEALAAPYGDRVVLRSGIESVERKNNGVILRFQDKRAEGFDKVIFACNADQALRMLADPTPEEQRLLGAWTYTEGRVVVHSDTTCFPKRELMNGYTFLYRRKGEFFETSVSGALWSLPGVSRSCRLISTQHPNFPIDPGRIIFEKVFRTPLFDFNSCRTIPTLPSLNGVLNTYYCGSHFGFGLHEDAVTSAMTVARLLHVVV